MKTLKLLILTAVILILTLSCDSPVTLGKKIDMSGPVIDFTYPASRKAVSTNFYLQGTASDDSGIYRLLVKAEKPSGGVFEKQWRNTNGVWEVLEDTGNTWIPYPEGEWKADKAGITWKIPIDMTINGKEPENGEYVFSIQAWNPAGLSDDNSYKTLVIIVDRDPPKVEIITPFIYTGLTAYEDEPLKELHELQDDSTERFNPALIGKFLTRSFPLQWQVDDDFDVWSIDISFYHYDTDIDNDPLTALPENYIYKYHINLPPPPEFPDPDNNLKPNGKAHVPALTDPKGIFEDGEGGYKGTGVLENPITEKTTVKVVASCYDTAGNINQEKTLGYFIYWPLADEPWIEYPQGMKAPADYEETEERYLIYPGWKVKANAFHPHGVTKVQYSVYLCGRNGEDQKLLYERETINTPRANGSYSTVFPWEFDSPPPSPLDFYLIKAKAFSDINESINFLEALFHVKDIAYPDFTNPPLPSASDPLYMHINNGSITITGEVTDAAGLASLHMVWINPQSRNYAAMSQLSYFRDAEYEGWKTTYFNGQTINTAQLPAGFYGVEPDDVAYDSKHPNKVWKLELSSPVADPDTERQVYTYSQSVNINDDLYIAPGKQFLTSQIFLLKAENLSGKSTIITYAPQGDNLPPKIEIENVVIKRTGALDFTCIPAQYALIPLFEDGDTIIINGTWEEDSTEYLDKNLFFTSGFNITINNRILTGNRNTTMNFTPSSQTALGGTWTATAVIGTGEGYTLVKDSLKDTLVVNADVYDIGGNYAQAGGSWLIESDNLRLLRITSDSEDKTYKAGDEIGIILEFNKPVILKAGSPVLALNSGINAEAVYETGQINQSTRQKFIYTVKNGDTTDQSNLNVTGIIAGSVSYTDSSYPFIWHTGGDQGEEIRILAPGTALPVNVPYYTRIIPAATAPSDPDYAFSLTAGKNITVDTEPPEAEEIRSNTNAGYYKENDEIYFTVKFTEPVRINGETAPKLIMQVNNGSSSYTDAANIKINDNEMTFVYKVKAGDTTFNSANPGNQLAVTGFTPAGSITDIAGTPLAANALSSRTIEGIYIETAPPPAPVVKIAVDRGGTVLINNVNGETVRGESSPIVNVDLKNVYNADLWLVIEGNVTGGSHMLKEIEFSVNNGRNWEKYGIFELKQRGEYNVIARQYDKAGNVSEPSKPVSFFWDPEPLVTRIDSSTPNGTYTRNNNRTDTINITVYFRKPLYISGSPSLTHNAGAEAVTMPHSAAVSQLSFTYNVGETDNTPGSNTLDIIALNITATDGDTASSGVNVSNLINFSPANTANKLSAENNLGQRKNIYIVTGALALNEGPNYETDQDIIVKEGDVIIGSLKNDEWTGTITYTFNRNIQKGSGNVTITQSSTDNYRLPAVLTEAQYSRYRNAGNINTYYIRGTNGAIDGASDTSTKYVLDFEQSAIVTPNNTGTPIQQMAYDFYTAETVTLPITSGDIEIDGNKLIINITGTNALQVLGTDYSIILSAGLVQDSLLYTWPASERTDTYTNTNINRPFARIDKKINQDTITTQTNPGANITHLLADFRNVIQTQARLDCRTPGSIVRYAVTKAEHSGGAVNTNAPLTGGSNWRSGSDEDNSIGKADAPTLAHNGETGTIGGEVSGYTEDVTKLQVGTNAMTGYTYRIGIRSRNGTSGTVNSSQFEEIAYRTVLTYQFRGMAAGYGRSWQNGAHLWIRGGDSRGSSNVPGFPLTWSDNTDKLASEGRRAGVRLLRNTAATGTSLANSSDWVWVTWEVNVETYFDAIMGIWDSFQSANDAWQYGPIKWSYNRGGWVTFKDYFTLQPGRHRILQINNGQFIPGHIASFSTEEIPRSTPSTTITMPTSAP